MKPSKDGKSAWPKDTKKKKVLPVAATKQPVASKKIPPAKTTAAAPAPVAKKVTPATPATPVKTTTTEDKSAEIEELNTKLGKLRVTIEGLEKERNFYFGKLRQIEVLCQQDETKDVETKAAVLKILYQTDTEEEFQAPAAADGTAEAQADPTAELTAEPTADVAADVAADGAADGGDLLASGAEETF